jgi:hypothetical protein
LLTPSGIKQRIRARQELLEHRHGDGDHQSAGKAGADQGEAIQSAHEAAPLVTGT